MEGTLAPLRNRAHETAQSMRRMMPKGRVPRVWGERDRKKRKSKKEKERRKEA